MSGFLRPAAAAFLKRWREVLAVAGIAGLGLWIIQGPAWIANGFGYALVAIAGLAAVPAFQRARFRGSGDAPGVVSVVEGQIDYLGPYYGGSLPIEELERISLRHGDTGNAWVLASDTRVLVIPVDATGAEALLDAFTQLPGLDLNRIVAARGGTGTGTTPLWHRTDPADIPRLTN